MRSKLITPRLAGKFSLAISSRCGHRAPDYSDAERDDFGMLESRLRDARDCLNHMEGLGAQENISRQYVLWAHLADVDFGDGWADALSALFKKFGGVLLVLGVDCFGVFDRLPQVFEDGGQVCFEQLLGMSELLDLRQFVVEEAEYEAV